MQTTDVPRQNPDTAARVIDETTYVLDPETSELHTFNDVGARVWELADGERSVAQIAEAIESEYEVGLVQAEADVVEFLDALVAKGLIVAA